jgi:transposase-like protein
LSDAHNQRVNAADGLFMHQGAKNALRLDEVAIKIAGERISSAMAESTVNVVVSKSLCPLDA